MLEPKMEVDDDLTASKNKELDKINTDENNQGTDNQTFLVAETVLQACKQDNYNAEKNKEPDSKILLVAQTVLQACKQEKKYNALHIPLELYKERASYYTGLPRQILDKLSEENSSDEIKFVDFDISCRIALLRSFTQFYASKETPSYEDIYEELRKQVQLSLDFPTALQLIKSLGYSYIKTKTKPGNILMENPKFTFERVHYVKKILKYRSMDKHIYYLDERIVESGDSIKIPTIDVTYPESRKTVYIHVVSQEGCVTGMFCYNELDCYKRWLLHILLPLLEPSSVVVINKNTLHGIVNAKPISRYHTKNEMLQWLKERNIPCNSSMLKAELYDLIDRCPTKIENQGIDSIFRGHDIEVLRLPERLRVLSLTTRFWKNLSNEMENDREIIHNDQEALQDHIHKKITSFPTSQWFGYSKIIQTAEQQILDFDTKIESLLDEYEIDKECISSLSRILE